MGSQKFQKRALATAVAGVCLVSTPNVIAERVIEEIKVTATAREQTVQEIPYNISAVTGEDLEAAGISNEIELLRAVSGATVVDRGARNSGTVNSIVIRGLNVGGGNEGDNALNAIATVSTYVDNTPMYAGFVLRDLERVELLRGPQGTLYGSGALGGTVRFISNKPNVEEFEGKASVDYSQSKYSDGDNTTLDLMLNIPLSETVAIRGHAGRIDNDGVVDQINAYRLNSFGEPLANVGGECLDPRTISDADVVSAPPCLYNDEDSDTVEIDYARIALRFEPSDELAITLAYQTQEEEIGGRRALTQGSNNARDLSGPAYSRTYDDAENGATAPEGSERDVDLVSLDVEWDLGFATLTSSTAHFDDSGVGDRDQTGLYADDVAGVDWLYFGNPRQYAVTPSGYENESIVQEFRLVSNATDARVDWLVGLFYLDEEKEAFNDTLHRGNNVFYQSCVALGGAAPANCFDYWPSAVELTFPGAIGPSIDENDYLYRRQAEFEEIAIYGEITYHLSDKFHLTGGLRWFDNEQSTVAEAGFPTCCGAPTPFPEVEDGDDGILVKLNLSYDISDNLMAYGTFSQGYRRGGVNAVLDISQNALFGVPGGFDIQTFDKDTVNNYEFGLKGRYEQISFSAAIFYVDWEDPQLNLAAFPSGFLYAQNGDAAQTAGFEAEISGWLNDHWSYRINYTFVDAELDGDVISDQDNTTIVALDGEELPASPENVLSLSLNSRWELSSGMILTTQLNAYYQDEQKNVLQSSVGYSEIHDDFWMVGGSATLMLNEKFSVTLYGNNLGNEEGITSSQPAGAGTSDAGVIDNNWYGSRSFHYLAQPRTIGLRIGYNF